MLKKCLLGLFVGFVGLIGFSNGYYFYNSTNGSNLSLSPGTSTGILAGFCFTPTTNSIGNDTKIYDGDTLIGNIPYSYMLFCSSDDGTYISAGTNLSRNYTYTLFDLRDYISSSCPECEECQECPEIDTGFILSGACDTNYCVQNDLCPSSSGSRSELMINNIVHEGKPLINVSIPDNIYWDYATDDNQFDLYVGSGYNQDYIDSVLAINSYHPDNEDFSNIFVSGLTLIFPYIFVVLLIVFIWKLLKRIFKY